MLRALRTLGLDAAWAGEVSLNGTGMLASPVPGCPLGSGNPCSGSPLEFSPAIWVQQVSHSEQQKEGHQAHLFKINCTQHRHMGSPYQLPTAVFVHSKSWRYVLCITKSIHPMIFFSGLGRSPRARQRFPVRPVSVGGDQQVVPGGWLSFQKFQSSVVISLNQ